VDAGNTKRFDAAAVSFESGAPFRYHDQRALRLVGEEEARVAGLAPQRRHSQNVELRFSPICRSAAPAAVRGSSGCFERLLGERDDGDVVRRLQRRLRDCRYASESRLGQPREGRHGLT
jgi:hypothetical protein